MIRLAYERYERGLSQPQVAKLAGKATLTISNIERGLRTTPETKKAIADAIGWDHHYEKLFEVVRLADNE